MDFKKLLSNFFSRNSKTNKKGTYVTSDPSDKNLRWGVDNQPTQMNKAYIVLSKEERAKGFVRPVRLSYLHKTCNTSTFMSREIAETYARDPKYYGSTFCSNCQMHRPISEFLWEGSDETVGS